MASDKVYWHRYWDFYEDKVFSKIEPQRIMEIGVLHGDSIRLLAQRFPGARITGVDITPEQETWPKDNLISYIRVDENSKNCMNSVFSQQNIRYDLIIDDANHVAEDQIENIKVGLPWVTSYGYYIIEDLDKALLNLFLAIEQLKASRQKLQPAIVCQLIGIPSVPSVDARFIEQLFSTIKKIYIYKRSTYPLNCYKCGSQRFDYKYKVCICGVQLFSEGDSTSVILQTA